MTGAFLQGVHNTLQAVSYLAGIAVVVGPALVLAIGADRSTPKVRRWLAAPVARWRHRRRVKALHRQYAGSGRSV